MKRKLTIEEHDGGFRRDPKSMIRIKGRWLKQAGFPPGASVELTVCSPGVIEIRLCAPPQLRADDFHTVTDGLTAACAKFDARKAGAGA